MGWHIDNKPYHMKKLGNGSWAKARRVCGIRENYRQYARREQLRKSA